MIITFYSFKGGVGRSMALANVAELLAREGLSVLMIDFDLEAPGLERFFGQADTITDVADVERHRGLIDLLTSYRDLRRLPSLAEPADGAAPADGGFAHATEPVASFVVPIRRYRERGSLSLLAAGRRAGRHYTVYADRVRSFNWDEFYAAYDGEQYMEWFRREVGALADVVLVDSRTGITEMSGVCTFQLADVVVMIAAPNQQNIDGCHLIGAALSNPRLVSEGRRGRELRLLPVPGRVERSESEMLGWFAAEFARRLGAFVPDRLRFETSPFVDLQIPYVPRYAYTETIAVRESEQPAAADLIAAFRRLTDALVQLAPPESALGRAFAPRPETVAPSLPPLPPEFADRPAPLRAVTDWLADPGAPLLLVTGAPGAGKTTFVRWLAELSGGGAPRLDVSLVLVRLSGGEPFDARRLVEAVAVNLAQADEGYRRRLLGVRLTSTADAEVRRTVSASTGTRPSEVIGLSLSAALPPEWAYRELVAEPARQSEFRRRPLVLIDAVDEIPVPAQASLLRLLADIATAVPAGPVKFLVTSRPQARIVRALGADTIDLSGESAGADVERYVHRRLALRGPVDLPVADRVVAASAGNFRYARLVLDSLPEVGPTTFAADYLPESLAAHYERQARRTLAERPHRAEQDAELLGVLAAAQAPLTRPRLAGITLSDLREIDDFLSAWAELVVEQPDGCGLFHRSAADWLRQSSLVPVRLGHAHRLIGRYFTGEYRDQWRTVDDPYAFRYTVRHLVAGAAEGGRSAHGSLARQLAVLLGDRSYLAAKEVRYGRAAVLADLVGAVNALLPADALPDGLRAEIEEALPTRPALLDEDGPGGDELLPRVGAELARIFAAAYERIRAGSPPGGGRTATLDGLVFAVRELAVAATWLPFPVADLLSGSDGGRVVGLAVAQGRPETARLASLLDTVVASRSAFEQFHGLVAARSVLPLLPPAQRHELGWVIRNELADPRGVGIATDTSRYRLAAELLRDIDSAA